MKVTQAQRNEAYYRTYMKLSEKMTAEGTAFCDLSDTEREQFLYSMIMFLITLKERHTKNIRDARELYAMYDSVLTLLSSLTPVQLERIFPIEKTYDGDRWEMKDYFTTKKALAALPQDEMILHNVEIFALLWDYCNNDIRHLLVCAMHSMDEVRRWMGKCPMIEEFLWKAQAQSWKELKPVKRQIPSWLRVIK